jgi:DNA polymerase-3 subunit epsilon
LVPIEHGRIRLSGSVSAVVRPNLMPTADSIRIHRLRPADLSGAEPPERAWSRLAEAISTSPVVVWAAWVETAFLTKTLGGSWRRRIVDVRNLVARADPGWKGAGLAETAAALGVPPERSHDALADAFVAAQVFLVAAGRLSARRPLDAVALRRFADDPGRGGWPRR